MKTESPTEILNPMKTNGIRSFSIIFLYELSHATNLFAMIAFLIFLPYTTAQNESIPSPPLLAPQRPSKPDGIVYQKHRIGPSKAIIIVCLISAFLIMGCFSISVRYCSEQGLDALSDDHPAGSRRRFRQSAARGLDSIIIDTFPMFLYSDVKGLKLGKGALECAVCLNEFKDDETLRLLPKCSHVFHPDCIDAWLASHITCPVCRDNLRAKPGELGEGEIEQETHESVTEPSNSVPTEELSNPTSQTSNMSIDIHIGSPEMIHQSQTNHQKRPRIDGNFLRYFSAGHDLLVQPGKSCERFTLRLPEDVLNRLLKSDISRTNSCMALTRRSSTKGFKRSNSGGGYYERFDHVGRSDGRGFSINPTPFERLFIGAERNVDEERSFAKLMPDKSPV